MTHEPRCPGCVGALEVSTGRGWCPACKTWTPESEWRFKPDFADDLWLRAIAAANAQNEGFAGRSGPEGSIHITDEIVDRLLANGWVTRVPMTAICG